MNIRKPFLNILFVFCAIAAFFGEVPKIYGAHGLSIDGTLLYQEGFQRFEYVSSEAKKDGSLILHDIGSFDKFNPYTLKGITPLGLEEFVFEPLAVSSLDEPFTKYGLIAKDIEVAKDKLSMRITIDEKARFSDGSEVLADDIAFSLDIMKSNKVHPLYAGYFHDIIGSEIQDKYHIKFLFSRVNRELPLIALSIPVLSKKFYSQYEFGIKDTLVPPLGTGPYVIDNFNQGKTITYKRNPHYWAREKNVRNGLFNFNTITVKFYKDRTVAVEAFKAGEFDVQLVNIAKQWARDMVGQKFDNGLIEKKVFPHQNNAGMQCFVMNMRNPLFQDIRVREALSLAFDFEWINKSLFYEQYTRSNSFFSNSYLKATGLPTGLELKYLNEFKELLPAKVFSTPQKAPVNSNSRDIRNHLREAKELLAEAGWKIEKGELRNSLGKPFQFEILLVMPSFSRVVAPFVKNLEKLGIKAEYRVIDQALYTERVQEFNYDMVVNVFGQSQSPGNEQRNYWHSEAAETKGSGNLAGIKSEAVDYLVDKIIYASTQEELTAACRALDRVLWYGYYVIPNWHLSGHRMVYYNKFMQPDKLPKYYNYLQLLMTWWAK